MNTENKLQSALEAYATAATAKVHQQFDTAIRDAFLTGVQFGLNWRLDPAHTVGVRDTVGVSEHHEIPA